MNNIKSIVDSDFNGKRMTFLQLIKEYSIVIPVIQRDYAQGRLTEKVTEVRKNFVQNLISYIKDEEQSAHELDFIYGTVNETTSLLKEFVPLDGQQRLTTLFLLHLYVAGRNGKLPEFIAKMVTDGKYRFSYKTRNSSTMFCERLLSRFNITIPSEDDKKVVPKETDIFEILQEFRKRQLTISSIIQNQGWFYKSWLNDPTIAGMLVMLDEIDHQFLKEDDLISTAYERLFVNDDSTPPITFQMLPLNGYSRTDDLYIKLNARGLHLSDFENFKARLEELMEADGMSQTCTDDFKERIDIKWNEYLWKYRGGADNTDRIFENLFRNFIAFAYRPLDSASIGDTMNYLLETNKKTMRFTFSRYCELGVFHKHKEKVVQTRIDNEQKMIEKIIAFMNLFCDDNITPENAKCDWLRADTFIHNRMIDKDSKTSIYSNKLRLYAYLQYYNSHIAIDSNDLNQWMRLVRNLDEATDIDDAKQFHQAIMSIDDLLTKIGSKGVQDWLSTEARNFKVSFFRQRQMEEECIKAELISREKTFSLNTIQNAVEAGDKDDYLTGQMGFALEFAGAYQYYKDQRIQTMAQDEIVEIGQKISEYTQKTIELFMILRSDNPEKIVTDRLVERALLTLGMYMRPNSANRWNSCNRLNDPYNSWKTLLYVESENSKCREIFKTMLDKISIGSLETDLNNIINTPSRSIPAWRKMLIDNKALIDYCTQGFLYIEDNSKLEDDDADVILLSQSQMNGNHSELFTRDLYEKEKNNLPIGYHQERKYDIDSTIYFKFKKEQTDEEYEFKLSHWNGKWEYKTVNKEDNDISFDYQIVEMADGKKILNDALSFIRSRGYI